MTARKDGDGLPDHPSRPGFSARRLGPRPPQPVTIRFFPPNPPVSTNYLRGLHWAKHREHLDPWRDAAFYAARQAGLKPYPPAIVTVSLPFRTRTRRDPANYVATNVKAIVDGLVLAGVWADDNPTFVTVTEPLITFEKMVEVVLAPRPEG